MKAQDIFKVISVAALISASSIGSAVQYHTNKNVGQLSSTYDGADCFYFTLAGVGEADPVKPGDPNFAIPRTQYGAKDAYAMLLSAKLTGRAVTVMTRGTISCGYASVAQIFFE